MNWSRVRDLNDYITAPPGPDWSKTFWEKSLFFHVYIRTLGWQCCIVGPPLWSPNRTGSEFRSRTLILQTLSSPDSSCSATMRSKSSSMQLNQAAASGAEKLDQPETCWECSSLNGHLRQAPKASHFPIEPKIERKHVYSRYKTSLGFYSWLTDKL